MAARQGRYAEAAAYYEQALARDPDRLDVLVQLGIRAPVRLEASSLRCF
jgi:tetratricopeptide (TPR) repeat protein